MAEKKIDIFQSGLLAIAVVLLAGMALLHVRQRDLQARIGELSTQLQTLMAPRDRGLAPGVAAPAFRLETLDGQEVTLAQLLGMDSLLVFVSSQCQACERVYPMLHRLQASHPDRQVVMVAQGPAQDFRDLAATHALTYPVAHWNDSLSADYQVAGLPFVTAIDKRGTVTGSDFITTWDALTALLR